jgi:hypothetical protein
MFLVDLYLNVIIVPLPPPTAVIASCRPLVAPHSCPLLNPRYVCLFQTHSNQQYVIKFNQLSLLCTTHTTNNTSSTSKNTNTMIPPSRQLLAAPILTVTAIALHCTVAHNLCNTVMLLCFYMKSTHLLFHLILFC